MARFGREREEARPMIAPAEIVERLARVDCCALSDALDRLRIKGAVTHLPQRSGAGRIAGIAVTFRVAPGDPPPGPARHLGTTAIEASDSLSIIVVEQDRKSTRLNSSH